MSTDDERELERHINIRAWNLARTMVANGASRELVALTFVQIAEELLPAEASEAKAESVNS